MKRGKLDTLIENLQSLTEQKQTADLLKIIKSHEQEIVDLNIKQMDEQGVDVRGNKLKPYRNRAYASKKRALNPRGVTDLHLTGAFHRDMFIEASNFPVTIDSSNPKTGKLKDQYGDIFGLTAANKKGEATEILKPSVEDYYRSFLVV
jgi:uncharacterized protein YnzC (UPF0291/DUF896 family)